MQGHLEEYDDKITELAETKKYQSRTKSLSCFRGIGVLSAMVIVTELGDIKRFCHPSKIVSYCGMDITEHTLAARNEDIP